MRKIRDNPFFEPQTRFDKSGASLTTRHLPRLSGQRERCLPSHHASGLLSYRNNYSDLFWLRERLIQWTLIKWPLKARCLITVLALVVKAMSPEQQNTSQMSFSPNEKLIRSLMSKWKQCSQAVTVGWFSTNMKSVRLKHYCEPARPTMLLGGRHKQDQDHYTNCFSCELRAWVSNTCISLMEQWWEAEPIYATLTIAGNQFAHFFSVAFRVSWLFSQRRM